MDQDQLRQLESDFDVNDSATTKGGGAGKSTLTSRLTPAPQMVFRVSDPETARALGESLSMRGQPRIMRDADAGAAGARDANGVSFGAEAAVDRAASSSGSALPSHLQRQFEGSLGADLSSVRVHTGSESAEAAHAVGAKAYTVGQDIHFAAGKYQPDDAFGMHLLAHEVAHTVQQSGGSAHRQNKLEVSAPQDAAEHEADHAADAMVRGEAATVSGASGVARKTIQRNPDPDIAKKLPRPVYWNNGGGGDITGTWSGAPTFAGLDFEIAPLDDPNAAEDTARFEKATAYAKGAFGVFVADWVNAQLQWNAASPKAAVYQSAAADAEKKGLLDIGAGGSGDLDRDLDEGSVPGADNPNGNAFDENGQVMGASNVKDAKLSRDERLAIDQAKKECATKTDAVKSAATSAKNQQREVHNAALGVENAKADLETIREEAKKQNLETQVEALEKSCELVGKAIGGVFGTVGAAKDGKAATGLAGAEAIADIINTLAWDSKISEVKGQMQVIDGSISQLSKIKALNGITQAKNTLLNAIGTLENEHRAYNATMRERATAYQALSTLMEAAATKGGANSSRAANVGVAVQAIPAMEYVVEVTKSVADALTPLSCSEQSAQGCAVSLGADQAAMRSHAGAIADTKARMTEAHGKWSKRLASAQAMVSGTR